MSLLRLSPHVRRSVERWGELHVEGHRRADQDKRRVVEIRSHVFVVLRTRVLMTFRWAVAGLGCADPTDPPVLVGGGAAARVEQPARQTTDLSTQAKRTGDALLARSAETDATSVSLGWNHEPEIGPSGRTRLPHSYASLSEMWTPAASHADRLQPRSRRKTLHGVSLSLWIFRKREHNLVTGVEHDDADRRSSGSSADDEGGVSADAGRRCAAARAEYTTAACASGRSSRILRIPRTAGRSHGIRRLLSATCVRPRRQGPIPCTEYLRKHARRHPQCPEATDATRLRSRGETGCGVPLFCFQALPHVSKDGAAVVAGSPTVARAARDR